MEGNKSNEMDNVRNNSRMDNQDENVNIIIQTNGPETSNVEQEQSEREREEYKNMLEDGLDELLVNALKEFEEETNKKEARNEELKELRKQPKRRKDEDAKFPSKKRNK